MCEDATSGIDGFAPLSPFPDEMGNIPAPLMELYNGAVIGPDGYINRLRDCAGSDIGPGTPARRVADTPILASVSSRACLASRFRFFFSRTTAFSPLKEKEIKKEKATTR